MTRKQRRLTLIASALGGLVIRLDGRRDLRVEAHVSEAGIEADLTADNSGPIVATVRAIAAAFAAGNPEAA